MNRVEELQQVRREITALQERERRLVIPIGTNMAMIRNLYDCFKLSLKRQCNADPPQSTENRKKFLYAVLYIFSPATIAGDVMRHKLRECVSGVLDCTPTGVSRDYKTALFFYATYKEFRESVDGIIRDMLALLQKEEDF